MSAPRALLRWLAAAAAYHSGLLGLLGRWKERASRNSRTIVLRYHRVRAEARDDAFHLSVSPRVFAAQMRYLKSRYRVVPVEDLLSPEPTPAGRRLARVCVTFDDGYRDNYTEALPVLEGLGLPFAVFVTTDPVGTTARLWWDELRELVEHAQTDGLTVSWTGVDGRPRQRRHPLGSPQERRRTLQELEVLCNRLPAEEAARIVDSARAQLGGTEWARDRLMLSPLEIGQLAARGATLGSHGASHRLLTRVGPDEARREIVESKGALEALLGSRVRSFAYPGGQSTPAGRQAVREAGYELAFTTEPGENDPGTDRLGLRRRAVHEVISTTPRGGFSRALFAAAVEGLLERRPLRPRPEAVRLLYVIDKLTLAGSQRHLIQLLRALDRSLFEPRVLCMESGGPLEEELRDLGVPFSILGVKNWNSLRGAGGLVALARQLRSFRPALVHAYLFTAGVLVPPVARLLSVPAVVTSRRDLGDWRSRRHVRLSRLANLFTDVVLTNSTAVRAATRTSEGVPDERLAVVHNGLEPTPPAEPRDRVRLRFGLPAEALVVGSVGNIRREKDPLTLLRAFEAVAAQHPSLRLALAGRVKDPALADEIERFVAERGLSGRVHLLGPTADVPGLLAALDVYVCSSLTEGFSNAVLEAMRASLPLVASHVGGNPEQVVPGVTGYLFPPGDWKACAEAIVALLGDGDLRAALGGAGRRRQQRLFDAASMARRTESLYARLLLAKGAPFTETALGRLKEKARYAWPHSPNPADTPVAPNLGLPRVSAE